MYARTFEQKNSLYFDLVFFTWNKPYLSCTCLSPANHDFMVHLKWHTFQTIHVGEIQSRKFETFEKMQPIFEIEISLTKSKSNSKFEKSNSKFEIKIRNQIQNKKKNKKKNNKSQIENQNLNSF